MCVNSQLRCTFWAQQTTLRFTLVCIPSVNLHTRPPKRTVPLALLLNVMAGECCNLPYVIPRGRSGTPPGSRIVVLVRPFPTSSERNRRRDQKNQNHFFHSPPRKKFITKSDPHDVRNHAKNLSYAPPKNINSNPPFNVGKRTRFSPREAR